MRFHSATLTEVNPFPFRSLLRYCPSFVIQLRFPLSCLSLQLSFAYVCVAVHQNSAPHSIMSPYTKTQLYSSAMPSTFMLCLSGCCRTLWFCPCNSTLLFFGLSFFLILLCLPACCRTPQLSSTCHRVAAHGHSAKLSTTCTAMTRIACNLRQ